MDNLAKMLRHRAKPTIYQIEPNLFLVSYWLMKLAVGLNMIDEARRSGRIGRHAHIVETTSGQTGYALALAGRAHGHRVTLVGDVEAIEPVLKDLLELLGARVVVVEEKLPVGGYQVPRLRQVEEILKRDPDALWVKQYDNEANPRAYADSAKIIAERVGRVDCLVCSVGTGGSLSGTTRWLRGAGHPVRAVAVDTHNSVLFGQADGPRALRGMGSSLCPGNVDHTLVDEVHWVTAADAFCATRLLFQQYALDMGPTTGAAFMAARCLAANNPDKTVVFYAPDRAERYLGTVYSRQWCADRGLLVDALPEAPYEVTFPRKAQGGWARMDWNRRTLSQVVGTGAEGVQCG